MLRRKIVFSAALFFGLAACFFGGQGVGVAAADSIGAPSTWLAGLTNFGINSGQGLGYFTDSLIPFIISALFFLLVVGSLIFLVIGGVMWIAAGGNKEGLAKAKTTVTYALVGLILGVAAFAFVNIIGQFFHLNLTGAQVYCKPGGC